MKFPLRRGADAPKRSVFDGGKNLLRRLNPFSGKPSTRRAAKSAVAKPTAVVAALALVSGGLVVANNVLTAAPAAAAEFSCSPNTIYTTSNTGEIRSVNVGINPSMGDVHASGQQNNALGISPDARYAYTLTNGTSTGGANKKISIYDGSTGQTVTKSLGDPTVPGTLIRGAVSPKSGIYYYGGSGSPAYLGAYDPATGQAYQIGTLRMSADGNGDFVFGADGALYVVADRDIYVVDPADIPTQPGTRSVPLTLVTRLPQGTQGNGIAFGADGKLFVSQRDSISEVDLSTGQLIRTIPSPGFANTDLSSCSYPNTLTVQKDVKDRLRTADQFTFSLSHGSEKLAEATTSGTATGVQKETAGPVFVDRGAEYTISETAAGRTDLNNYVTSLKCVDLEGRTIPNQRQRPHLEDGLPRQCER